MNSTGVVAALAAEARALGVAGRIAVRRGGLTQLDAGTLVYVSGIGKAAASVAAQALIQAGADSLVSWGMAGGLDPQLRAGTVCLPHSILSERDERFETEMHRREALRAAVAGRYPVAAGTLLTSTHALDTIPAKHAAYLASGAAAVDMESAEVARVAAQHGVPFIAMRVIVDTANDTLPPCVVTASRGGAVNVARLLWELVRAPGEISGLLRLSGRYRAAQTSMRGVARSGALAPLVLSGPGEGRVL